MAKSPPPAGLLKPDNKKARQRLLTGATVLTLFYPALPRLTSRKGVTGNSRDYCFGASAAGVESVDLSAGVAA